MLILGICQQYISLFLVHTETLTDSLGSCWSSRRQPWTLPCSWRLILILLLFPSPSVKPIRDQFEKRKSISAWDFPIDSQHPHLICPLHSLPICSLAYLTLSCVAPSSVFMSLYLSSPPVLSCAALKKHWPSYLDLDHHSFSSFVNAPLKWHSEVLCLWTVLNSSLDNISVSLTTRWGPWLLFFKWSLILHHRKCGTCVTETSFSFSRN